MCIVTSKSCQFSTLHPIPHRLPSGLGRRGGGVARMVGPDLVTTHLGPEPPATKAGSIAVVPEIELHIQAVPDGMGKGTKIASSWL